MKLKKIFFALAFPFLLSACQKDSEIVPQISTDKGTYEMTAEGGTVTVKLLATEDWTATIAPGSSLDDITGITVAPASGSGSDKLQEIKINVPANDSYDRKALVSFIGDNYAGAVTISQKGKEGERLLTCTVAEFLEKPVDASVYYVLTGIVKSIAKYDYGNFYLQELDGSCDVLIYGLAYKSDIKNQKVYLFEKEGIQIGDEITIASTRGAYGTTIEGMNSYYISHKKSEKPMIKLGLESYEAAATGETFVLPVTSNKATWTLTSDVDWLTFDPASASESVNVNVTVAEGVGGEGTITLSAPGLESQTCKVTRAAVVKISCEDFLKLPEDNSDTRTFELSGIISGISATDIYGNVTITDHTGSVPTYSLLAAKGGEGKKFQELLAATGLKNGDFVTVQGPHDYYAKKTTHQLKNGWYVSHIPSVTMKEFKTKEVDKTKKWVVTGVISMIDKAEYGNFIFSDGSDETGLYAYTTYNWAGEYKKFAELGVEAGDEITLYGNNDTYTKKIGDITYNEICNNQPVIIKKGSMKSFAVEPLTLSVSAATTTAKFKVTGNAAWTVTAPAGVTADPTSGTGDKEVTLTFAANTGADAVKYDIKVATAEEAPVKEYTVALTQAGVSVKYSTVAEVHALTAEATGDLNVNEVVVKAIGATTFYVEDATGGIFVYLAPGEIKVGDKIKLNGCKTSTYGGHRQISAGTPEVTGTTTVAYPDPKKADETVLTGWSSAVPLGEFCEVEGAFTLSGNYYNVLVGTAKASLVKPAASLGVEAMSGKTVKFKGYTLYAKSSYVYFIAVACEAVETGEKTVPTLTVTAKECVETGRSQAISITTNSDGAVSCKSADESIVKIDAAGKLTGVAAGTVNVTVSVAESATYKAASAECEVTVTPEGTITGIFDVVGKYGIKGTSSAKTKDTETITISGYEFIIGGDGANGCAAYSGYFLFGKKGAYIKFPAIEGKTLKSVTILTGTGASTSVQVGIYSADGSAVVAGGEVITLNAKDTEFTYNLTGTAAGTAYRMQVASSHNAQAQKITLVYSK